MGSVTGLVVSSMVVMKNGREYGKKGWNVVMMALVLAVVEGVMKMGSTEAGGTQWMMGWNGMEYGMLADSLSVSFMVLVGIITTNVVLFSKYYMANDPGFVKFVAYLGVFGAAMLMLVESGTLLTGLVGWELVGIASMLLISFWSDRWNAVTSSLRAIFINRIGDVGFFVSVIASMYAMSYPMVEGTIVYGLLLAAFVKSAQFGFHIWLPEAMEGPTPVSALLHAATMVTAGLYLTMRMSMSMKVELDYGLIGVMGGMTALIAGIIGTMSYDVKKVIAYSTCSQLGFIFLALSSGHVDIGLLHLLLHGGFKCLLFLTAAYWLHTCDLQDVRTTSGATASNSNPIAFLGFLVGTLSLLGMPFFSGFYSKEPVVMEGLLEWTSWFVLAAAFFSSAYSSRVMQLLYGQPNGFKHTYSNIHFDGSAIPIVFLIVVSVVSGWVLSNSTWWYQSLGYPSNSWLSTEIPLIPLVLSVLGIAHATSSNTLGFSSMLSLVVMSPSFGFVAATRALLNACHRMAKLESVQFFRGMGIYAIQPSGVAAVAFAVIGFSSGFTVMLFAAAVVLMLPAASSISSSHSSDPSASIGRRYFSSSQMRSSYITLSSILHWNPATVVLVALSIPFLLPLFLCLWSWFFSDALGLSPCLYEFMTFPPNIHTRERHGELLVLSSGNQWPNPSSEFSNRTDMNLNPHDAYPHASIDAFAPAFTPFNSNSNSTPIHSHSYSNSNSIPHLLPPHNPVSPSNPDSNPDPSSSMYIVLGSIASVVLFASLYSLFASDLSIPVSDLSSISPDSSTLAFAAVGGAFGFWFS